MFVGWLKEIQDLTPLKRYPFIDTYLIKKTQELHPEYAFSAHENDKCYGMLTAYPLDEYLYINALYYANEEIQKRLCERVLTNAPYENIFFFAPYKEKERLSEKGFIVDRKFFWVGYKGIQNAFNFSNRHAKEVNSGEYQTLSLELAKKYAFLPEHYLEMQEHKTSLRFATLSGFQHSHVIEKKFALISPWIMKPESFMDAEKLLRAVIYYRGLKQLFARIPDIEEIVELYNYYNFEKIETLALYYRGKRPNISYDTIYAY